MFQNWGFVQHGLHYLLACVFFLSIMLLKRKHKQDTWGAFWHTTLLGNNNNQLSTFSTQCKYNWGKSWKLKIDGALAFYFFFLRLRESVQSDAENESCLIPSDECSFCFTSNNILQTYKVERFARTLCHRRVCLGPLNYFTQSFSFSTYFGCVFTHWYSKVYAVVSSCDHINWLQQMSQ